MAELNWDKTEDQVESPESLARQFAKRSEITELKANETENLRKRYSLPPNKIYPHWLDNLDKAIKSQMAKYESIISDKNKEISDLKLALKFKPTEDQKVSQSSHAQSTQTEPLPWLPHKPTPPKEGVPRKNGRHHGRHQTYPFSQDGIPLNNYSAGRDVGIQTVLPSNPKKGFLVSIFFNPEFKGRRSSFDNDLERHTPKAFPPIRRSFHHSHAGTVDVEIPAINCATQQCYRDADDTLLHTLNVSNQTSIHSN